MTSPAEMGRRRAIAVAGHQGDSILARAGLSDPSPSVRATAIGALVRLGQLTETDLIACLGDPSRMVQHRACEAAAGFPGNRPPSLMALLASDDSTLVEVAAWASGERRPPEPGIVAVLSTLATEHDDALVREAAVAALGSIGDEAGLPAILTAAKDKATVRRRAIIALAPFEGAAVDEAIALARDDRDWQVRQAAEDLT